MEKQIKDKEYTNPNGNITKYQVETYKNENENPITVVRNSPDNQGEKFGETWQIRDKIIKDLAIEIKDKFQIEDPKKIELYQERLDGDYDRVDFNQRSNNNGELVWSETDRVKFSEEHFEKRLTEYEKGQHTEQDKAKMPGMDRGKLLENREEIKNYQNQVNQKPDSEKQEQTSSKQNQQDEISRNQEKDRSQEISR